MPQDDVQTATVAGARRQNRIARMGLWLAGWATYLRTAANDHMSAWQSTLLSCRKFTHPDEVTKMRQPVRPATRATWYR
jgi:hypothetical protein